MEMEIESEGMTTSSHVLFLGSSSTSSSLSLGGHPTVLTEPKSHFLYHCSNNNNNNTVKEGRNEMQICETSAELPVQIRCHDGSSSVNCNGRYLVASKDFQPGDLIFTENALISGPSSSSSLNNDGLPVCLSCYSLVHGGYKCEKCQWPVCNRSCEQDRKHALFECHLLASRDITPAQLSDPETITVLRCLLLRDKDPRKWAKLMELSAHQHEGTFQSGNAMALLCASLTFINQTCDLDQFDYDVVETMTNLIDVNGLGSEDRQGALLYRYGTYVYEHGSLLAHSCIPNAHRVINLRSQLEVYASVPIREGEMIKTVYTETFLGTLERRQFLHEFFYLSCNCERCASPTECNTYFQAVKCQNSTDENGVRSCQTDTEAYYLPLQPLDPQSEWQCSACHDRKTYDFVVALKQSLRMELEEIDGERSMDRVLRLEAISGKHRGVTLHPNHFLILRTEYDMVQRMSFILYRNRLIRTQVEFVERYIELTRKILVVFNVILPGFNRHRARVLYFLQQGLLYLLQYKMNPNNKKRVNAKSLAAVPQEFSELVAVREEGKRILKVEPEGSEECLLANEMLTNNNEDVEAIKTVLLVMDVSSKTLGSSSKEMQ